MKKQKLVLVTILIVSILFVGQPIMVAAQSTGTKVDSIRVNGNTLDVNNLPVYENNGQVMIPLRTTTEMLGYKVEWKSNENSVELNKGAQWTKIKIGEDKYFFAKMAPFSLGAAPEIKESRTYVPLEFFAEVLKCHVNIANENVEISADYPKYSINDKLFIPELKLNSDTYISDYKYEDVNGDGVKDHVLVAGVKENKGSIYSTDVMVIVQDGKTEKYMEAAIGKDAGGYGPSAFIGDFNNDKTADVLLSIATGGSGGIVQYALLSFKDNKVQALFDYEKFNEAIDLKVKFLPDYKAELKSDSINKSEILDLSYNKDTYDELGIYDNNGKVKNNTEGWIDSYGELKPVDIYLDGNFELIGTQRVSGYCHADSIAHLVTTWKWDGQKMNLEQTDIMMPFFTKEGDVNGNGSIDNVTLKGTREFGSDSLYVKDIKVQIYDKKDSIYEEISVDGNDEGYAPQIFLGNFNNDKAEEMLISVASGGSGGMSSYSLLSFKGNKGMNLFDQEKFSRGLGFDVTYKDGFKADIFVKEMNKTYTIDISRKKEMYIENEMYTKEGKLLTQLGGMYNPLSDLKAIDIDDDGILELVGTQYALGTSNAETLGHVQSIWKIDNNKIKLIDVMVSEFTD